MQKKAQEVIITAAITSSYPIVKVLHSDGYKIFDKMADDRFFFSDYAEDFADAVGMMERHIDRIRIFKAQVSRCVWLLFVTKINCDRSTPRP